MNENVETYLIQVSEELTALPAESREAELREVRDHLNAMIEARVARGVPRPHATASALHQFGNAQQLGRGLSRAWQLRQPEPAWRALAVGLGIVPCQIAFFCFYDSWLIPQTWALLAALFAHPKMGLPPITSAFMFLLQNSVVLTPVLCGWIASLLAPHRGWWAALTAYISAFVVLFLLSVSSPQGLTGGLRDVLPSLLMVSGVGFGAWLGKRARQRRALHPLRVH